MIIFIFNSQTLACLMKLNIQQRIPSVVMIRTSPWLLLVNATILTPRFWSV